MNSTMPDTGCQSGGVPSACSARSFWKTLRTTSPLVFTMTSRRRWSQVACANDAADLSNTPGPSAVGSPTVTAPLAEHDAVRIVVGEAEQVRAVVDRVALAAEEQERREAGGAAARATLHDASNGAALGHRREAREVGEEPHRALDGRERVEGVEEAAAARWARDARGHAPVHRRDVEPVVEVRPVCFGHGLLLTASSRASTRC